MDPMGNAQTSLNINKPYQKKTSFHHVLVSRNDWCLPPKKYSVKIFLPTGTPKNPGEMDRAAQYIWKSDGMVEFFGDVSSVFSSWRLAEVLEAPKDDRMIWKGGKMVLQSREKIRLTSYNSWGW